MSLLPTNIDELKEFLNNNNLEAEIGKFKFESENVSNFELSGFYNITITLHCKEKDIEKGTEE